MPDFINEVFEEGIRLYSTLSHSWLRFHMDDHFPTCTAAMQFVVCGLAEMRVVAEAYADDSGLRLECTLRGKWRDAEGGRFLPERIRTTIPAWRHKPKIIVQLADTMHVRWTPHGRLFRDDLGPLTHPAAMSALVSRLSSFAPPSVSLRVLGPLDNIPGRQPVAVSGAGGGVELVSTLSDGLKRVADEIGQLRPIAENRAAVQEQSREGIPTSAIATHAADFTSVDWFGTRYTFSKGQQSRAIEMLWKAWQAGGHGLSQETIAEELDVENNFELRKVFRRRQPDGGYESHPAWNVMIRSESKGVFRLAPPHEGPDLTESGENPDLSPV